MKNKLDNPSLFQATEIELFYRNKVKAKDRPKVRRSSEAYEIFLNTWDMNKIELVEEFKMMMLNRRGACLGISTISLGGMAHAAVDQKVVFALALKAAAHSIIVAHNHPSGEVYPSDADKNITNSLRQSGKILDLTLSDHLIVSPDSYFSFADRGLIP